MAVKIYRKGQNAFMIDVKGLNYCSNHNHTEISNFRLRDCIIKIPDLINRALELGYNGVCCTDHEALTGHVRLLKRYQELQKLYTTYNKMIEAGEDVKSDKDISANLKYLKNFNDFKIGLGNEIYLVDSLEEVRDNYTPGKTQFYHFILIAKDLKGYEQLKRISSESAWANWYRTGIMERVPTIKEEMESIIGEEKGHLIAQTACLGGELDNLILDYLSDGSVYNKKKIDSFIKWCINLFGKENFFLEIQPCIIKKDENGEEIIHEQKLVNQFMFKLAKAYDLNVVVTTDSHYLHKEDKMVHEAYLKADDDDKKSNREVGDFYETTYMLSKEELVELLSTHLTEEEITAAFAGTQKVHDLIEIYDLHHDTIVPTDKRLPDFKIKNLFKDYYKDHEYIKKFAESDSIQDQYLLYLTEVGFEKKNQWEDETYHFQTFDKDGNIIEEHYKTIKLKEKIDRINEEFSSFWQISERLNQKLSAYYVLVRGLIHEVMWKVSFVGVARGSVGGSYIAYLTEITQINPLKFDLPFWRHSSPLRPELPDVDIDSEAAKRQVIFDNMHEYYGDDNVLNTLTLKTEGTKSTVQVCARGFEIPLEDAQFMADLVPFERGANWTLNDCFNGNEEKGRQPVVEFIKEVEKYPNLKETMLMIEGLISGRSIHASASYVFDAGYLRQNSRMRAPNGTWITAYNMEDSDFLGGLKIDTLTIQQLDKLHKAIDLLIEDGTLKDMGSIKANYDTYLHPDVLEYNDYDMWNKLDDNLILDAFQFDSVEGKSVIKKVEPRSMLELSTANSLMRLMAQDGATESPADTYKRYKANINLWYAEMDEYHLTTSEKETIKKYLGPLYGVADTQEAIMELSMDPKISGFDVAGANKLRKAIAKKKAKLVEEIKNKFYAHGAELGNSKNILDYVWNVQICRQLGYAFSKNHCMPYTCICMQCMNSVQRYGFVYWNCACLCVNSGSTTEDGEDKNTTDYGRVAIAIGNMRKINVKVVLPDINRAGVGFKPDAKRDEIIFGLKAISGVGNNEVTAIMNNRPYKSATDFYQKMQEYKSSSDEAKFGDTAMIQLIKAGCFDELESRSREQVMEEFIHSISNPIKELKMTNILDLNDLGLLTEDQKKKELRYYKYRLWVFKKENLVKQEGKSPATGYYALDKRFAEPYFLDNFAQNLKEGKDYFYTDDGRIAVKRGSFDRLYDKLMENFKVTTLTNEKYLAKINEKRFKEVWEDKAEGNISRWEMDSLNYYYHDHELKNVDRAFYDIKNFNELSPNPEVADYYYIKGQEKPRFKLCRICGTVIDRNKNKHIVTVLTPDGVVNVKLYKGQFTFYDKASSRINEDGSKTILEKSWFSRGNMILITGYRREEQFVPKKYSDSVYNHTIQLITGIDENGRLSIVSNRVGEIANNLPVEMVEITD